MKMFYDNASDFCGPCIFSIIFFLLDVVYIDFNAFLFVCLFVMSVTMSFFVIK